MVEGGVSPASAGGKETEGERGREGCESIDGIKIIDVLCRYGCQKMLRMERIGFRDLL